MSTPLQDSGIYSTSHGKQPLILFFRERTEHDPYDTLFREAGFRTYFQPVLSFEFINQEALIAALEHPGSYGGLILTSPRAVEAMASVLRWLPGEIARWHAKPVFVVGSRTASDLREIGFEPEGESSGSGDQLARYITTRKFEDPLLFLCGNRRRDELPDLLSTEQIPFEELCVYETRLNAPEDLSLPDIPDWVVFFSPSGVESIKQSRGVDWKVVRKAAIGKTTSAAMEQNGWAVDVVAPEPSADALLREILSFQGR